MVRGMSMVFFELSMSLDGYVAGPNVGVDNPLGDGGERLHDWMFDGRTEGESRAFEEESFRPAGAMVMGRRMLDLGIGPWGEDPTFHMPVYVVTHRPHEPIVKQAGRRTTSSPTDSTELLNSLEKAAGAKNIVLGGGADIVQQSLAKGVVDEMEVHLVPTLLGAGTRLFENTGDLTLAPNVTSRVDDHGVTHLRYRLVTSPSACSA
jgi:dihydrofolate reductase